MLKKGNNFIKIRNILKGDYGKKISSSFSLKILGLALSYLFMLIVSRIFGAEAYGKFSLSFTVLNIFALVFALGVPDAIVKIASDKNIIKTYNYRKISLVFILVSALVGSVLLFLIAPCLSEFYKDENLTSFFIIAALTLVPLLLLRLNYESLRGQNEIIKFSFLSHIIPYFVALFVIVCTYFYFNINDDSLIIKAYAIGVCSSLFFSLFWVKKEEIKKLKRINYPVKHLIHYSLPMLATSSFIFIMGWTDTLMLGYYNSKADVGIYNVVIRIARIAIIAITSINLVLAPKVSELYSISEIDKMKEIIRKSTKLVFFITAPVVLIILISNKLVLSIFGNEFITGSHALIIILISQLFNAMSGSVGQVMNMTGNHKILTKFTLISAVINIALNFLLIPIYGIIGAAIATASSSIILNLFSIIFVKQKLGIITYYLPFSSNKN